MRQFICIVTLLLLTAGTASAQFLVPPPGIGVMSRGGIGFGYQGRRFGLVGGLGYSSVSRYGGFPFGGYYGYSIVMPPPIIVMPPPIIVVPPPVVVAAANASNDTPPPPIDPKKFIVIRPDQPARPNVVPPRVELPPKKEVVRVPPPKLPVAVEKPGKPTKAAKPVDLGVKPKELPLAQAPDANPRAEADRQIELGKAAFALGELGRAMERFKQAVAVAPAESTAYFLLAQAQFALGKYPDAVATIDAGLKLRPDWPQTRFRSREAYGPNGALFDEHLRQLRLALEKAPDDPRLMYLLGVELWFDAKRDEAVRWFEQAAKKMLNTGAIERFIELGS